MHGQSFKSLKANRSESQMESAAKVRLLSLLIGDFELTNCVQALLSMNPANVPLAISAGVQTDDVAQHHGLGILSSHQSLSQLLKTALQTKVGLSSHSMPLAFLT